MYKIVRQDREIFSDADEKKVAQYLYEHFQYKNPDTHLKQMDVYCQGEKISETAVNRMIETYYQNETQKINARISFENTTIGRTLVQFNIVSDWYFEYFKMVKQHNHEADPHNRKLSL